ncbi:MAG: phosphoribosyltransferase [Parachlamydiales bacterium]|nr:phosphoribosyltransferase [Parachlamydiales bacterium]
MFKDRVDAAEQLALALKKYQKKKDHIILGLPRGGVIIAAKVAKILGLPLDIIIPRKIPAPNNPELAIGGLCEDSIFLNNDLITELKISSEYIQQAILKEKLEASRRKKKYLGEEKSRNRDYKTVIIIDDGIATGATIMATIQAIKVKKIIIAVPVAPKTIIELLQKKVDEVVVLLVPDDFYAIGQFYEDFPQITDQEIIHLLRHQNQD